MKLDRTQINKIIHNVISYDYDENGYLHFHRFTPTQFEVYKSESEGREIRARASASVAFDFITDAEYIAIRFILYPGSSRICAGFDLYVDGIFHQHKFYEDLNAKMLSFALPEGEHRVTVYFPWCAETVVKEVHITDGASIKEIPNRKKVIFLGDSITQGVFTEYPSLTYVNQVAAENDIEIINQGIGGYRFNAFSIDDSLTSYHPDAIVLAYGTNDYSQYDDKQDFIINATEYIEKITDLFPQTKILAILPIYRNDGGNQTRERYRDYTLEDARRILENIYGKYENISILKETGIPRIPDVFMSDYLHPTELGFTFMAKTIGKELKKCL